MLEEKNLSKITLHILVKSGLKASQIYLKYSLIKLFFPGDFLHFKQSVTSTTSFTMYKHQVNQIQHSYHTHNIDTVIVFSDNQIFKVFKQIFYSKITITVVSTTLKNNRKIPVANCALGLHQITLTSHKLTFYNIHILFIISFKLCQQLPVTVSSTFVIFIQFKKKLKLN